MICFVGESKLWQQDWKCYSTGYIIKRSKNTNNWWNNKMDDSKWKKEVKSVNGQRMLGPLIWQLSDTLSNTYAH